ncbi:radical SAM protein [bacterium]|nr:radical SAM protein [bacterium]
MINLLTETYAKTFKKCFFCKSLNGKMHYNNGINSDLSISCTCNDRFGEGKIGNLNNQSLKEIFFGKKANKFRKLLSNGKIPVTNCLFCPSFKIIPKNESEKNFKNINLPKVLMIENTVNCNLTCLSCNRKKIYSFRKKRSMSLKDIEKISKIVKKNKIKKINYFILGEAFSSKNIKKELEIIRKYNPKIQIFASTNGAFINNKEKKEAALMFDKIVFSIHGCTQKSTEKYQRGINFEKSFKNMKELVELRNKKGKEKPKIHWKYVLFRWNDSKKLIKHALRLSKKAKVDRIFFEKTISPLHGASYIHYLKLGYLDKICKNKNKKQYIFQK